ncbi:MAG: agmatinase family protein [Bryobacteraceae bacterium]
MTPLHLDPNWPRASAWLAGEHSGAASLRIGVLGVPLRLGSISPGRCDLAPAAIRAALQRFSTWDFEHEVDIRDALLKDHGDADVASLQPVQAFEPVVAAVQKLNHQSDAAVLLGGDNSLTRPGVHGLGVPLPHAGLLTLDAHLDLRDLSAGLTNGNPVRALLADGLPGENIAQVGIQSFANSPAYAAVAREARIKVIPMGEVCETGVANAVSSALAHLASRVDAIYVDLDLDVLDRAFAPATPGSRPGGLSPWELRQAAHLCGRHPKVRMLDLVEIDPEQDIGGATSLAAAACLLSFASGVLMRSKAEPA